MNLNLAAMYGTPGAQPEESLQKLAEAELFTKLAAENGIDLNALNNEQIQYLWDETMGKTASEEEPPAEEAKKDEEKKDEEKKEAAAREHAVKLAHAEEEQRAHHLGQVMAHSYVAELSKIAAAREAGGTSVPATKEASAPAPTPAAPARAGKQKEGSALDSLALGQAVKIAEAAGFDGEEAARRVSAVHTLGLNESTKLAQTVPAQIEVRALEYLEAAGYPVTWDGAQG